MDGTKNMQQMVMAIMLLIGIWLLVLTILLGLLDVALSHCESIGTRLLGMVIGIATLVPSFALALWLSPLMIEIVQKKITISPFDKNPNVEVRGGAQLRRPS